MLINLNTDFDVFLPTGITSSSTVTEVLTKCFYDSNWGDEFLIFIVKIIILLM